MKTIARPRSLVPMALLWAALPLASPHSAVSDVPAASSTPTGRDETILDTRSCWRSFYVLRPAPLSERLWKTVELPAGARRLLEWDARGRKMDELPGGRFLSYSFNGHWATSPIIFLLDSPPPPADWFSAEFDDSTWVRMRYPMMMNAAAVDQMQTLDTDVALHGVAQSCFRGRFHVDDPAAVGGLTLRVVYRGGLAVWVNGREVGRGHLPDGPITPETSATEYEEHDYVLPPRDDLEEALGPMKGSVPEFWMGGLPRFKGQPRAIADIGGTFMESIGRIHHYFWAPITPDEYDALLQRRDRVLEVTIDRGSLRKGVNVIALQSVRADLHPVVTFGTARLGPAGHYGWAAMYKGLSWLHNCIVDVQLRAAPGGAVRPERRPGGVQVWAESPNKRVFSPEFGDPDGGSRLLRMVGARQGTYSGQIVVGTERELRGLNATIGDLTGPDGARIPSAAVSIRYMAPRPVRDLALLGFERHPRLDADRPLENSNIWMALWRFGQRGPDGRLPYERLGMENAEVRDQAMRRVQFFDELDPRPPATVPPDSCQPIWVSVKIPSDAAPGHYGGTLRISAEGVAVEEAPVRVYVMDWTLPDPTRGQDFSTMVAMEQSPWGVAKAYGIQPWSDEHFAHIDKSLRRLGELGNDYLIIPVLLNSEFGNRDDSFVTWVRGADGALSCDFSRFDRYMDLARKHMPRPAVVVFGVAHPEDNNLWVVPQVLLRDEVTGQTAPFTLPMGEVNPIRERRAPTEQEATDIKRFFAPFVRGVIERMEARGLGRSVFWGYVWDYTYSVERYRAIFEELAPETRWARGCHGHGSARDLTEPFGFQGTIVCLPQPVRRIDSGPNRGAHEVYSHRGWQNPTLHLSLPRGQNAVLATVGSAVPYYWRLYPELALCGGARGIARIGADYWERTCQDGWRGGGQVGISVTATFWPGRDEANSSARFEMLREGLQEAEARVIIEKALEGPLGRTEHAARIQKMLDDRIIATTHIMRSYYTLRPGEQDFAWQQRSWDLYAAAAHAAGGSPPGNQDRIRFFDGTPRD